MGQQVNVYRKLKLWPGAVVEGLGPMQGPGTDYYVDKTGHDGNDGRAWGTDGALLTIQAALDKCSGRGIHRIFVGPGSYAETLTTPINATAPFGQLIGYSPSNVSMGATYLSATAGTTDEDVLTVRARGWRIAGFEFACPTEAAGIKLQKNWDPTTITAEYTEIDHCHFTGGLMGINNYGSPSRAHIHDNEFDFILQGDNGIAIGSTFGAVNANLWQIIDNIFIANTNHIIFNHGVGALKSSLIKGNTFQAIGLNAWKISLDEANAYNCITQNHFMGTYSYAGGYRGGTTDEWWGNYANLTGGITVSAP